MDLHITGHRRTLKKQQYRSKRAVLAAAFASLFLFGSPTSAIDLVDSSGTEVRATVCNGSQGSSISISTPASDQVINISTISIQGTVEDATQITVEIDGQYSQTVPLGSNQTSYQIDVTVSEGTHTIVLIANDLCAVQNGSTSLVVTYEPKSTPSDGGSTPTDVNQGGVAIGTEPSGPAIGQTTYQKLRNSIVVGPLLGILENLVNLTGLDVTAQQAGPSVAILRVALFSAGVSMLTFTSLILEKYASGALSVFTKSMPANPVARRRRKLLILRLSGLGCIVLALFV